MGLDKGIQKLKRSGHLNLIIFSSDGVPSFHLLYLESLPLFSFHTKSFLSSSVSLDKSDMSIIRVKKYSDPYPGLEKLSGFSVVFVR